MRSEEFRRKFVRGVQFTGQLRLATNPVCLASTTPDMQLKMFERIQAEWVKLGESEPYWSVLTNPKFTNDQFEQNREEFFTTGARTLDLIRASLARNRIVLPEGGVCVELGCGVGRVSVQLAGLFKSVHGYDISPGNLALARQAGAEFGRTNIEYHLIERMKQYEEIEAFDFFFSVIVFQHNPPPVQKYMLERIVDKARPGALLYFQVPVYSASYRFDAKKYLASKPTAIEMHVLPQSDVFDVLQAGGCRIVETMEDTATGHPEWISMSFLAQKRYPSDQRRTSDEAVCARG